MDWNGNLRVPFVPRPADQNSYSFLYNYNNNYDGQFPVLEMKQPSSMHGAAGINAAVVMQDHKSMSMNNYDPKKKRLSNEQLELLEKSFQEDIKLDPDRKMKLAKELALQPRQIAVWFQNRRARWKGKQLERLYDALKQDYDNVSRDKHKLQQEVMALRAILKDQVGKKQVSTEISGGEETVESTSIPRLHQIAECNYPAALTSMEEEEEDYNNINNDAVMMPPYWATPMPN